MNIELKPQTFKTLARIAKDKDISIYNLMRNILENYTQDEEKQTNDKTTQFKD